MGSSSFEGENLMIEKLNFCCNIFDYTKDLKSNLEEKDRKQHALLELVDYIKSSQKFSIIFLQKMTKMVSINLFRTLPPSFDPAWDHLRLVYELLKKLLESPWLDAKLATRYIDSSFVLKLFHLFDSEDYRERTYLHSIVIAIHEKFEVHRPLIMKELKNIFGCFSFESEMHNGISELLMVLNKIISGFVSPLNEEHKLFLVRTLIPLYKPQCIIMYQYNLNLCIKQFLDKDCKLADTIILRMLKYWPTKNSLKQISLLNGLKTVLQAMKPEELKSCVVPMFRQSARCLTSARKMVANQSLCLLRDDCVKNLIKQNHKIVLPIILPALEKAARNHWDKEVRELARDVSQTLSGIDPELFEECLLKFQEEEAQEMEIKLKREAIWKCLEKSAACKELAFEHGL